MPLNNFDFFSVDIFHFDFYTFDIFHFDFFLLPLSATVCIVVQIRTNVIAKTPEVANTQSQQLQG